MPLVDLKTSLKTLKFGKDLRGGGNSNQPYERFSIPDLLATPLITDYWQNNDTNIDYPLRGGGLYNGQAYTLSGKIDKDRISKFFKDSPRGPAFIQKQIGLQKSNPKMETGTSNVTLSNIQSLLGSLGATFGLPAGLGSTYGAGGNNQVYNDGRNTLAQVLSSGTGAHIPRAGATPINLSAKYYVDTVGSQIYTTDDITKVNRLLILQSLKVRSNLKANQAVRLSDKNQLATAFNFGISTRAGILFDYLGGPGSTYGDGSTIIKRSTNSSDGYDLTQRRIDLFPGVFTMAYDKIANNKESTKSPGERTGYSRNNRSSLIQDFRQEIPGVDYLAWDSTKGVDYRFYNKGTDKLNAHLAYELTYNDPFTQNSNETDDMIKFGFECMSNDQFGFSTPLIFRAFLNKGIGDTNTAQLNPFKYMGRGETFYTYQGFERSISFGFKIVAFSKDELFPLYSKLNYLVSQVYPDYSTTTGVMRAPLIKLTIGDYVYRMPGFLGSVNLSVDVNAPWDLNEDADSAQLPKIIDVDIDFKPIFDELPRRSTTLDEYGNINQAVLVGDLSSKSKVIPRSQENVISTRTPISGVPPAARTDTNFNPRSKNILINQNPGNIVNTTLIPPIKPVNVTLPFTNAIIPNK
jgi:hypothetical protein